MRGRTASTEREPAAAEAAPAEWPTDYGTLAVLQAELIDKHWRHEATSQDMALLDRVRAALKVRHN